ncbi:DUF362 domain-containing protein [Calorimonas adulescens]|jgi:Domain of unknown function (DUF362).|uniref:DUF362 domain-containing protein n=1 Tax=Calorimonas adulescens TaxID=2606906 RepID=A0A5D8QA08_9THEO|nr:DUF362 domain-containing protein [Calorimonas adulescens]TZE81352.1 DUF362 domain-containing protein [Calorimonas adulescens]
MDRTLYVIYGNDGKSMVKQLLKQVNPFKNLSKNASIALKPNLVVAKSPETGATTDIGMIMGIIEFLKDYGFNDISIMEGSWVGDSTARAYRLLGYEDISKRYGVKLYDLKKDSYKVYDVDNMSIKVCDKPMSADYLINLPVLKAHCQTRLTCALKNLKGCIPDEEKRRFHTLGIHRPVAYLNKILRPSLHIVDGIIGDLTFEEGGTPVNMNRIIMGYDPVLIDTYAAQIIGYDYHDIGYIPIAESIGVGSADIQNADIVQINEPVGLTGDIYHSRKVDRLARYINEREACSACYGSLIHALERLDEKGLLDRFKEGAICIGQGFKGVAGDGVGVGRCTSEFNSYVDGCPPVASRIVDFLSTKI